MISGRMTRLLKVVSTFLCLIAASLAVSACGTQKITVGSHDPLYGGAVLMGLAITTTIVFGQFAISRRPSLLALACGTLFSAIVFVPYILTFPGVGTAGLLGAIPSTSAYLWMVWHTVLPASFAAYALLAPRDGTRRVGSARTATVVAATVIAAYAAIHAVFVFDDVRPLLEPDGGTFRLAAYFGLATCALLCGVALVVLRRGGRRSVVDAWLACAPQHLADTYLRK